MCLPIRLPSGFVSQFCPPICSPSGFSFTLAGVLCPPRWAYLRSCLPICFPSGFVFHLGWGAVSASLHRAVIKPPIHPPTLTLPTHHLIHPASVPAVACHQCGQPRSPKCSEATSGLRSFVGFGLVKITVLSHGQESFPGLVWAWPNVLHPHHGQSLSTVRRSAPWTELSVAKPGVKLCQANVGCSGGPSSLP